jgi:hypothetical protein
MSRAEISRENGNLGRRPRGSLNKTTVEIRAVALLHAPQALAELVRLLKHAKSGQVRVAAIKEILDRAYGKSPQSILGEGEGEPRRIVVTWGGIRGDEMPTTPGVAGWSR